MTLSATTRSIAYTGNGVTTAFAVPFVFWDDDEIEVIERVIATGVETTKTRVTHYTVAGGLGSTGTVTALAAPASTVEWHIRGKTLRTQEIDYVNNDNFDAETHEEGLDRAVALIQELELDLDRTPKFPKTDPSSSLGDFPNSVDRASQLLGFDANGVPIASSGTGGITISTAMTPVVQAATLALARSAMGVLRNERLAKTANYTVANTDNGKTIACGTAPWTLTFSAIAAGNYDADFWVLVKNESSTRAILCSIGGGTNFFLWPGQTALVYNQNSVWQIFRPERWKLPGNTTFYIDGSGSSSNDGLASGAAGAVDTWANLKTILLNDIDFNGKTITVQLADATYTASLRFTSTENFVGGGKLILQGNTGTPANVVISTTGDHAVRVQGHKTTEINITGMTLQTATAGSCVYAYAGGVVRIGSSVRIGAGAWGGLVASEGGQIWVDANFEIISGATLPLAVNTNGYINCISKTITFTGTPAWNPAGVRAIAGVIDLAGCTMSGSATGKRYDATENGVIRVGGGGANYFPGNVAGTTATGGQYN